MKRTTAGLLSMILSGAALAAAHTAAPPAAHAGSRPDPKQTARCNSEARAQGLKHDQRKVYLETCMKGVANTTASPQSLSGNGKPALETAKP